MNKFQLHFKGVVETIQKSFLKNRSAIERFLYGFKQALEERLEFIHGQFQSLKDKGYAVDAIAPQAAIYLTIKFDLKGKKYGEKLLQTQADVTDFLLSEAKLAVVPFNCFGADINSPWYRLSVGTCKMNDLTEMFSGLEKALSRLI